MAVSGIPLAEIARLFSHVREAKVQNTGARVEAIQRWCGGAKGDAWCCYAATMWLDLKFGGASPIPRLGACDDVYRLAKASGWLRDTPQVDDLVLWMRDPDGPSGPEGFVDAHHIGLVTDVYAGGYVAIAGNTSEDGKSNNGDRTAERPFDHAGPTPRVVFVRYPKPWAA